MNDLEIPLGTTESVKIEAKPVTVLSVRVDTIEKAKAKKAIFTCKHPDMQDFIDISATKFIAKDDKISTSGTWYNLDKEGKIQKGSALFALLSHYACLNLKAIEGQTVNTILDDKGYLAIKAY